MAFMSSTQTAHTALSRHKFSFLLSLTVLALPTLLHSPTHTFPSAVIHIWSCNCTQALPILCRILKRLLFFCFVWFLCTQSSMVCCQRRPGNGSCYLQLMPIYWQCCDSAVDTKTSQYYGILSNYFQSANVGSSCLHYQNSIWCCHYVR